MNHFIEGHVLVNIPVLEWNTDNNNKVKDNFSEIAKIFILNKFYQKDY